MDFNLVGKSGGFDRFFQVAIAAGIQYFLPVTGHDFRRQCDDYWRIRELLDLTGGGQAIHDGHLYIHEDKINLMLFAQIDGLLTVSRFKNSVVPLFQQKTRQIHILAVVVGNQYRTHLALLYVGFMKWNRINLTVLSVAGVR